MSIVIYGAPMQSLENRLPPPLLFLVVAALMVGASFVAPSMPVGPLVRWGVIAVFFVLAGATGPLAIAAFNSADTTINPVAIDKASALVTAGPFRFTRNPMYVSMTALLFAWAAWLASPWTLLGPLAFLAFITRFQIIPEERVMRLKFGADFAAYAGRVRRWL